MTRRLLAAARLRSGRVASTLAVAIAMSVGVAACGDDDTESGGGIDATAEAASEAGAVDAVTVTADEYSFDLSDTPTAETTSVTFDNQGEEFHVLVFARISEGFTLDQAVNLEGKKGSAVTLAEAEAPPGEAVTVEINEAIEPGDYALLCPIGGPDGLHYKLGQLAEFEVE